MCGYKKQKEIPRKAFLLISVSLCLANARALELLSLRTQRILNGVYFLVRKCDTEVRAIPQNTLKTLHFYGMDARVSQ